MGHHWLERSLLLATLLSSLRLGGGVYGVRKKDSTDFQRRERALQTIHDIAIENMGTLCVTEPFRYVRVNLDANRYDYARQKADMAADVLQTVGINHHNSLIVAMVMSLLNSDSHIVEVRVITVNETTGSVIGSEARRRPLVLSPAQEPVLPPDVPRQGERPDRFPWYEGAYSISDALAPRFMTSPADTPYRGWWTFPYYNCEGRRWLLSYSVRIPPLSRLNKRGVVGFLSLDVDVSELEVNQCDKSPEKHPSPEIADLKGSHKCHNTTSYCEFSAGRKWVRGGYVCRCRPGFFTFNKQLDFNGTLVELTWQEKQQNISSTYDELFRCHPCAPGCEFCHDRSPCLANYNWPFRISLLTISVACVFFTLGLICYVYNHRRLKVFKVASPIFLSITLLGCSIMYLEMGAIFPVLDLYSCIATKWTRHMGFCVTYTALLMKTWRVSLTYRVKSAHKVKLTDKQLLQWMFPIILVMLIYLGTWTLSAPPTAEVIRDSGGLKFNQCSYNWWDHSLAIGEVLFLAWGIKVCYNVRNAESLYNEARMISYAIYNIAFVNITAVAFHLFIFPHAGPDIKYLLGFIRTQLSTSVTVGLVFGPKVFRVLKGQGDQYDNRARARGVTASFSLNGIGLMPEETADLYQENEELKEEIQKLAAQIEFMKIVHMEMNNRHLKPKPGGYFNAANAVNSTQSPAGKAITYSKMDNAELQGSRHPAPPLEMANERV